MEWYKGSWRLKWLDRDGYVLTFENLEGVLIKRPFRRRGIVKIKPGAFENVSYCEISRRFFHDEYSLSLSLFHVFPTEKRKVLINRSNRSLEGPREDIFRRRILGREG